MDTGGNGNVLYIEARRANAGTSGLNIPFTATVQNLSKYKNNVSLQNFTGNTTDGYSKQPILSSAGKDYTFINLLGNNGSFSADSNADGLADNCLITSAGSFYMYGGCQMFVAASQNGELRFDLTAVSGHMVYACAEIKADISTFRFVLNDGTDTVASNTDYNIYQENFVSVHKKLASSAIKVGVRDGRAGGWNQVRVKNMHVFDLTEIFGANMEPSHSQMDVMMREALANYGYINARVLKIAYMDFITTDGIDSYSILENSEAFDFSSGDFAIGGVFITPSVLKTGYILSRNTDAAYMNTQFALYINKINSRGVLCLKLGKDVIRFTTTLTNIYPSAIYVYKIKRINHTLKCELNGVEVYNEVNDMIPEHCPYTFLFGRSAYSHGRTATGHFKGHTAMLAVYGHGVDETEFDAWFAQAAADYVTPTTAANTAKEVLDMLRVGISIGNALAPKVDVQNAYELLNPPSVLNKQTYYETLWGNPVITKEYVNMLKAKEFKTIRLPISWWNHMNASFDIEPAWLARVKEVIDHIIDLNTYCIINLHHDSNLTGWLKADSSAKAVTAANFAKVWGQIANSFKAYGDHLIFEGYNEILNAANQWENAGANSYSTANYLNQVFVDTVRSTGGNNAARWLSVNTYASSAIEEVITKFVLPKDSAANKLIVQLHSYDQNPSTLHTKLKAWHTMFTSKKVPLILGESGTPRNTGLTIQQRADHVRFLTQTARKYNIAVFWWDDGNYNGQAGGLSNYSLIDRITGTWAYPEIADAMVTASAGGFDRNEIASLEPLPTRTLKLWRQWGAAGFCFIDPLQSTTDNITRPGDSNYCLFRKIDITKLKSRAITLNASSGSPFLVEFDIYGKSIYTSPQWPANNTTLILNENTAYIQFGVTWMNDTSTLTFTYMADENIIYI